MRPSLPFASALWIRSAPKPASPPGNPGQHVGDARRSPPGGGQGRQGWWPRSTRPVPALRVASTRLPAQPFADAVEFAKRTRWQIPLMRELHIVAVISVPQRSLQCGL